MRKIFNNKRKIMIAGIFLILLVITLGYAYLKSILSINGNTGIASNSWVIYFDNIVEKDDNIEAVNVATIDENKTKVSFDVDLQKAQDTYEFNVDIVNDGTIDAQIDKVIKSSLTLEQVKKLEYVITYEDGTEIKPCDTLPANSKKNIVVKVRLRQGEEFVNVTDDNLNLSFEIDYIQYDESKECDLDDTTYTLTIDPDGGSYKGSTNPVVIENLKKGTTIKLEEKPIKEEYYFKNWITYNNDDYTTIYESDIDTVTIQDKDAYIKADYKLAVGPYKLYIDPNGGTFKDSTEITVIDGLLNGKIYYIGAEPELETKLFRGWKEINSDEYTTTYNALNDSITIIDKDAYLQAEYGDAIARIVETNKYYATIEKALLAAEPGQTVELLDDTEENPTNYKKVKRHGNTDTIVLDLGGHKVTGKLVNNDILTLRNGTIENVNGIAVINNGTLTLGDNEDDKVADKDNIKLIGSNTNGGIGLQNKGVLNFYDGWLDAFIGLDGIFSDLPTDHYVFVDHDDDRDCQQVFVIERPTRAVARSVNSNGGIMFYFNLQDAFDTSAQAYEGGRTLIIEAIKDFEGAYALDLVEGKTAFFDVRGYTVSMGYTLQNHGNLTIMDRGNTVTGAKGKFETSATMENYGLLTIKDLNMSATTNVNLLNNEGSLNIEKSTLTALNGYVMEIKDGSRMDMDDETYLKANGYALYLTNPNPFTIKGGHIEGIYNTGNLTIEDGTYVTKSLNGSFGVDSRNVSGRKAKFTMNGGVIDVEGPGNVQAIHGIGSYNNFTDVVINKGTIKAKSTGTESVYAIGIACDYCKADVSNLDMYVESNSRYGWSENTAYGAIGFWGIELVVHNANVNIRNTNVGVAVLVRNGSTYLFEDGEYYVKSDGGVAYGSVHGTLTVNDGTFILEGPNVETYFFASSTIINGGTFESSSDCFRTWNNHTVNGGSFTCGKYGVTVTNGYTFTMNGGTMTSKNNAINNVRYVNINGGTIISEEGYGIYSNTNDRVINIGVGIDDKNTNMYPYIEGATSGVYINNASQVKIDKAKIVGKTEYGVYTNSNLNVGNSETSVTSDWPNVQGDTYGLYINNGTVNIYDGIFKGYTWGYYGYVAGLPDAGELVDDVDNSVDPILNVSFIREQNDFLELKSNGNRYNSLQRAINAIGEEDTIIVLSDHDIKNESIVPEGKKVTIDFQNNTLLISKDLINNGELILTDTKGEKTGGITARGVNAVKNNNKLTINAGIYSSNYNTTVYNVSEFIFNDGKIIAESNSDVRYGVANIPVNNKTSYFTMNDGLIEVEGTGSAYGIYNEGGSGQRRLTFNGGTINVKSMGTSNSFALGMSCGNNCDIVINNLNMDIKSNSMYGWVYNYAYGAVGFCGVKMTIYNANISVENISTGEAVLERNGGVTTIYDGTYNVKAKGFSIGFNYNDVITIKGGSFIVNSENRDGAISDSGTMVIDDGTFISNASCLRTYRNHTVNGGTFTCGKYGVEGTDVYSLTMTGGTITSKLTGIQNVKTVNMSGGTIISEEGYGLYSNDSNRVINIGVGIDDKDSDDYPYIEGATTGIYIDNTNQVTIDKAKIVGKTEDGIYTNSNLNLGNSETSVSNEWPLVQGNTIGLSINNGFVNVYDGIFKGIDSGYSGFVTGFPDGYSLVRDTEIIDGETYQVAYLSEQENYLKIKSTGVEYNSLQQAINAINEEDEIIVLASHDVKNETTIPLGKKVTIDFQNNTLLISKNLINNGELILTDTIGDKNGGIVARSVYAVKSSGKLKISAGIYSSDYDTVIYNTGDFEFDDGKITLLDSTYSTAFGVQNVNNQNKISSFTMNGGTIEISGLNNVNGIYSYGSNSYFSRILINDGTIKVTSSGTGGVYSLGINCYYGRVEVNDLSMNVESNSRYGWSETTAYGAIGFWGTELVVHNANVNIRNTNVGEAVLVRNGSSYLFEDGEYNVQSNGISYGFVHGTTTIDDGIYNFEGPNVETYIFSSPSTVNGGTIYSSNDCFRTWNNHIVNGGSLTCGRYGVTVTNGYTFTMNGGSITSKSNTINNVQYVNINGGTIISEEGYGIYSNANDRVININPSEDNIALEEYPNIEGTLNGVYIELGTLNVGSADGVSHPEYVVLKGGEYGLYISSNAIANFYDGKLKGTSYGYNYTTSTIKSIENGYYIYEDAETIDETDYIVNYLKELTPIVKNTRTDEIYNDLQKAFNETKSGDTLVLIDDVQLFYAVTVDKNIDGEAVNATLDFDGFEVKTTNPITVNSGVTLNMVNNHESKDSRIFTSITDFSLVKNNGILSFDKINFLNTSSADSYMIITNNGGVTTIDHSNLESVQNVYTYAGGTTNINNSTLKSTKVAIYDAGVTNVDNCTITADTYGVYSYTNSNGTYQNSSITGLTSSFYKYRGSSVQDLDKTDLLYGSIYNGGGTLNVSDANIIVDHTVSRAIDNRGTTTISGIVFADIYDVYCTYGCDYTSISNSGTLTFDDVTYTITSGNMGSLFMISNGGTFNSLNSSYEATRTYGGQSYYGTYYAFGIYSNGIVNTSDSNYTFIDAVNDNRFEGIRSFDSGRVTVDGDTFTLPGKIYSYAINSLSSSKNNTINDMEVTIDNSPLGYALSIASSDFVINNLQVTATGNSLYGIKTDTGNVTMEESNITLSGVDVYGIYTNTAKVIMKTGTIDASGTNVYGAYINNVGSELVLGEKDLSENAGTADADVSITNPEIKAMGTTSGIGVKKIDGLFRFYDGVIKASTAAKPDTTSETDHINYAATTYYDDENDYEYCVLEYVKDLENKNNMSAMMKNVYYSTINAAVNRSNPKDTIIMQSSLNQNIVIPEDKEVVVDLNGHILSGTITNDGILTVINGEITLTGTTYNIAITNNGKLYIGKNDGIVIDDYVIILGNTVGLQNNGVTYMYDGYIRGTTPVRGRDLYSAVNLKAVNELIQEEVNGEIEEYDTVHVVDAPTANITIEEAYNYEFDSENLERTFTVPESGYYLLEVWGAQGGSVTDQIGGYGGYSKAYVYYNAGDVLYINVGQEGMNNTTNATRTNPYNGGGLNVTNNPANLAGDGGGATHIALESGTLATFEDKKDQIVIVAGGGGGASNHDYQSHTDGGHAGGYIGNDGATLKWGFGAGGTQTSGGKGAYQNGGVAEDGSFGQGGHGSPNAGGGGGGGYYGGGGGFGGSGGGGSGYIGNVVYVPFKDIYAIMYGYNVTENTDGYDVYTLSTDEYSSDPEPGKAKAGDGYARITKLTIEEN